MGLQFEEPLFLLLLIPVLWLLYHFWRSVTLSSNTEKRIIITLRFLIFTLIILALANPTIKFPVEGVTTVFVVDHSESLRDQQDNMYEIMEEAIEGMSEKDTYAIISVAEDGQVVQALSKREKGIISNVNPDNTSFTNLEEGLQVASSLISSSYNGRIVLLTDGNENIGDVKRQISILNSQDIEVDVIPFNTTIENDIVLERFEVPRNLFLGEQTTIHTNVSSTIDTTARLRISKNNELVIDETIQIKQGTNVYSFDYLIDSTGTHSFQAELSSEGDEILQNNVGYAISTVEGTPKVLLVEGSQNEASNIEHVFDASGVIVDTISPTRLPTTLTGVLDYESIVFSNVSATDVTQVQMDVIESAVKDFGLGFIMTGGNKSYGLGGYFKTPIERLLPVEMDLKGKNELPSLGLIIVLDRSGSMAGYKMDLAKEAAARSVELLREKDTLGFIAFDDSPWQIIETGPLENKEEAAEQIRSVSEGGGTNIFPALELAYEQLTPLELKRKHIILVTDGQSATDHDYMEIISNGLEENVTLSTVAIGSDADHMLLQELAEEGNGRYYDVYDASTIPSILSRETILSTRTYIEDNPFFPMYIEGTEWSPIFQQGVPQMNAYVATEPKSRAEKILVSDKGDPILIRWKYGLGNTIAWTSDVNGEWAGNFPIWEQWPNLWNEMLTWSLPSYQQEMYHVQQEVNGKEVILSVSSDNNNVLPLEARLLDEKGNEIDAQIRPTAPGEHEITFQAETGVYYLQLSKLEDNQISSTYQTGIVVPYSKEFDLVSKNNLLLNEIIDLSDGQIIEDPKDAFREIVNRRVDSQPIFTQLLLASFLLFFVEIAIRRFGTIPILAKLNQRKENLKKKHEGKKKTLNQTFDQLKSASKKRTSSPITTKKQIQHVEAKPKKQYNNNVSSTSEPKPSYIQESTEDRMKRLLDAKNRKSR